MRTMWRYLWPLRGWVALSLAFAATAQVLTLIDPIIFGVIIDDYALDPGGKSESELIRGALGWLLLAVVVATAARLASALQNYLLRFVVQKFGLEVFDTGMKHTLRLSFQEFEDRSSGETVAMLHKLRTDTERFIAGLVNVLFSTLVGLVFLLWYSVTKHWMLAPVFGVGVLALGALTSLLSQRIKTTQRSIVKQTTRLMGVITESLRNIELVKSLGLALPETRRIRRLTRDIYELEMQKTRRVRTLAFLQGAAINLMKHSVLFILLWLIFRSALTPGELISMQFIVAAIFVPLQDLGNVIVNYREAEASLSNFDELIAKPLESQPEVPIEIGLLDELRFEDVVFRHRTASDNAMDHVSFTARVGDTIAFVGPSGAGKSTLVKLLVGLYRPTSGRVLFDGVLFEDLRFNRVRRQFGLVSQDPQVFSGTVRDNLLFVAPDATDQDMLDAVRRASAHGVLERSGKGLDTRVGEGGVRLSGGERQRLSIARALLREPRLFIFDEATSALDSITEQEISESIREICANREQIVVMIAHRLSTIAHADVIYVLEKGRIVESGDHSTLLAQQGLYYAMWRQQVGERGATSTQTPGDSNREAAEDAGGEEPQGGPELQDGAGPQV